MESTELMSQYKNAISHIKEAKTNNRLVIFVGAGVSLNSGIPLWGDVIKKINDRIDEPLEHIDNLKIPQIYYNIYGNKKYEELTKEILRYDDKEPNELHKKIINLEPLHIITTNYDDFLEKEAEKEHENFYSIIERNKDIPYVKETNYIVKMHGGFNHGIVLKEDDYNNYSKNFSAVETLVKSLFLNNVVLFVGYSLSDPDTNQILTWIKDTLGEDMERPYLLKCSKYNKSEYEYYRNKGIEIIHWDALGSEVKHIYENNKNFLDELLSNNLPINKSLLESIYDNCEFIKDLEYIQYNYYETIVFNGISLYFNHDDFHSIKFIISSQYNKQTIVSELKNIFFELNLFKIEKNIKLLFLEEAIVNNLSKEEYYFLLNTIIKLFSLITRYPNITEINDDIFNDVQFKDNNIFFNKNSTLEDINNHILKYPKVFTIVTPSINNITLNKQDFYLLFIDKCINKFFNKFQRFNINIDEYKKSENLETYINNKLDYSKINMYERLYNIINKNKNCNIFIPIKDNQLVLIYSCLYLEEKLEKKNSKDINLPIFNKSIKRYNYKKDINTFNSTNIDDSYSYSNKTYIQYLEKNNDIRDANLNYMIENTNFTLKYIAKANKFYITYNTFTDNRILPVNLKNNILYKYLLDLNYFKFTNPILKKQDSLFEKQEHQEPQHTVYVTKIKIIINDFYNYIIENGLMLNTRSEIKNVFKLFIKSCFITDSFTPLSITIMATYFNPNDIRYLNNYDNIVSIDKDTWNRIENIFINISKKNNIAIFTNNINTILSFLAFTHLDINQINFIIEQIFFYQENIKQDNILINNILKFLNKIITKENINYDLIKKIYNHILNKYLESNHEDYEYESYNKFLCSISQLIYNNSAYKVNPFYLDDNTILRLREREREREKNIDISAYKHFISDKHIRILEKKLKNDFDFYIFYELIISNLIEYHDDYKKHINDTANEIYENNKSIKNKSNYLFFDKEIDFDLNKINTLVLKNKIERTLEVEKLLKLDDDYKLLFDKDNFTSDKFNQDLFKNYSIALKEILIEESKSNEEIKKSLKQYIYDNNDDQEFIKLYVQNT